MKKQFWYPELWMVLFSIAVLISIPGCSDSDTETYTPANVLQVDQAEGYTNIDLAACQYNLDNLPVEPLSDAEKNSILFMREEEKLARDIYLKMDEKWSLNIFSNIAQSEQTHMDAMLQLIVKYNLTDPVGINGVGEFTNDSLQALYNQLLLQGETGIVEALEVGALIEEVDILDLKIAIDNTVDNQDVLMVYNNLYKASRNHLRAFVKNLANRGVTYVPSLLTQAEYNAIINGNWETGH